VGFTLCWLQVRKINKRKNMSKMYILQNENTVDLIVNENALVSHFEGCRKQNEHIEKDYLTRNPEDKPRHLNWDGKEITSVKEATAYYDEVMEEYDYYSMFVLDFESGMVDSKIANIHNSKKFNSSQKLEYSPEKLIEHFFSLGATKDENSPGLLRILQSDMPAAPIDTVKDIPFMLSAFDIAYKEASE